MSKHTEYLQKLILTLSSILAIIAIFFGLYLIWEVLLFFFVAFILASALRPTVLKLKTKFHIPQVVSVISLLLFVFICLSIFLVLVVPIIAKESHQLTQAVALVTDIPDFDWGALFSNDIARITAGIANLEVVVNKFGQSIFSLVGFVSSFVSGVILTVTLFVVTYYFIISYDHLARLFAWMLPGTKQEKSARALKMLDNVSFQLGWWIRGRLFVMFLIGICTYIGLTVLGIPYALPLAIAATLLEIIPNIGPILAAFPAVALAFFLMGPGMAVGVAFFYIAVQQVESSLVTPLVMKQAVDVHPLTTVFLILIALHVMGLKGGLLVLPLYVTVRSVVQELWPHSGPLGKVEK